MKRIVLAVGLLMGVLAYGAPTSVAVIDAKEPKKGWSYDNGREFGGGAQGSLTFEADGGKDKDAALVLDGDFSDKGLYVQTGKKLSPPAPMDTLSFWLRYPGQSKLTVRLIDSNGTCHQVNLRLRETDDWQRIVFPARDFFEKMSESKAAPMVDKYEHWGKNDKEGWKGALREVYFLNSKHSGKDGKKTLELSGITVIGDDTPPAQESETLTTVALDDVLQIGEVDWRYDNGQEFKGGAKGELSLLKDAPSPGKNSLRLMGDFVKDGGIYVQAMKDIKGIGAVKSISMKVRAENCKGVTLRIVDGSGQCFQTKGFPINSDGKWNDVTVATDFFNGKEHWGGVNDGKVQQPIKLFAIILTSNGESGKRVLDLTDISAQVATKVKVSGVPVLKEAFESPLKGWEIVGDVKAVAGKAFSGKGFLQLNRTEAGVNKPISAVSPTFNPQDAQWEVKGAASSAIYSPDTSYQGTVILEFLTGSGQSAGNETIAEFNGTKAWTPFKKVVKTPANAAKARLRVTMLKTYGTFNVDDLQITQVQSSGADESVIDRIMIAPDVLSGIFLPEEAMGYKVSVWSRKPVKDEDISVKVMASDFWGAEVFKGLSVPLKRAAYKDGAFQYEGRLELPKEKFLVGPFYRVNADVTLKGEKPQRYSIGAARLPEAPTKKLPAESVPITMRNWDNRIKDYFFLNDRIGIRLPGIWGGWDKKAPYKAHAPSLEFVEQLGGKYFTGTPAAQVERGDESWSDPEMLKQGAQNFVKTYGERSMGYICLGNEPHGGPEQVKKNVAAYKAIYEAIKAVRPDARVVATSVEPNEEYFRQGYYKYCDYYDFHTYESYTGIRKTVAQYKALMKKYNAVKPLFSTELGLNCQGLSRLVIAQEIIKKFAVFFAEGCEMASWFTIMYPDPKGTMGNTSGSAFQIYDCRYNKFNPKLDAVTLYQAVNCFADKKFISEQAFPDGTQVFLFANARGEAMQIVWNDKARVDIGLELPGVKGVATLVQLDGRTDTLTPVSGTVGVTACIDPLMICYTTSKAVQAPAVKPAPLALASDVMPSIKGTAQAIAFKGAGLRAANVRVIAPEFWGVNVKDGKDGQVICDITAPTETEAQLGRLQIQRVNDKDIQANLLVEVPLISSFTAKIQPFATGSACGAEITLSNHDKAPATLRWKAELVEQYTMSGCTYQFAKPETATANFTETAEGSVKLEAGAKSTIRLPLANFDPQGIYRIAVTVADDLEREVKVTRLLSGFAAAPYGTPKLDGDISSDEVWKKAPVMKADSERQIYMFKKDEHPWGGKEELSAEIRYAWDDEFFYIAADVKDDVFSNPESDTNLWKQDGLQLLIDPNRGGGEKMGYYDCSLGVGQKGPQAAYHSTAYPEVLTGLVPEIKIAMKRGTKGNATYEIAIPWSKIRPFKPIPGANLGMGLIINDLDEGLERKFIGWFSGCHLKETDMVGDIILVK